MKSIAERPKPKHPPLAILPTKPGAIRMTVDPVRNAQLRAWFGPIEITDPLKR